MSAEKVARTPGPWRATPHSSIVGTAIVANRGIVVASVLGVPEVCQANARLIASSPIMYEYIRSRAQAGDERACEILESIDATR